MDRHHGQVSWCVCCSFVLWHRRLHVCARLYDAHACHAPVPAAVVRNFLIAQNVCIGLSAASILTLFHWEPGRLEHILLVIATILTGALSKLARVGSGVALEKDWVVVIAHGDKDALAGMNAVMRRIDLSCKILAPAAVGVLIAYSSQIGPWAHGCRLNMGWRSRFWAWCRRSRDCGLEPGCAVPRIPARSTRVPF